MKEVIRRQTLALVLEVEASVAEAEEGQTSREIVLPRDLVRIVEQGVSVEWSTGSEIPFVGLLARECSC